MRRWGMYFAVFILLRGAAWAEPVTVYAAASLTSALQAAPKPPSETKSMDRCALRFLSPSGERRFGRGALY